LRNVVFIIQQMGRRYLKAFEIVRKGNADPFAIGGGLFVRKRQAAECLRQGDGSVTLRRSAGTRH
jgi:hypothetical protein